MSMQFLLDLLQLSVVQIILVACIGALIGEMKKEVDDATAVHFGKFMAAWLSSGFGGVMVGLLLQGTIAKDNIYIILGATGVTGFAGHQQSFGFATRILNFLTQVLDKKGTDPPAEPAPPATPTPPENPPAEPPADPPTGAVG